MKALTLTMMLYVLLMLLFVEFYNASNSYADQVYPDIRTLTQPDGTTFTARAFGDENGYWVETTEQYAIVQNQQGYWTYAVRNAAGWLAPTAFVIGEDDPAALGIPKNLRPFFRVAGTPSKIQLALLITFSDVTAELTADDFEAFWFDVDSPVDVTGWYTAASPSTYYGEDALQPDGTRVRDKYVGKLVIEAVQAADATVNFGKYDKDGDCYVDLVMVAHQGLAQEETKVSDALFSLPGTLNEAQAYGDGTGEVVTNDMCHSDMPIKVNAYSIQPETRFLLHY